MKDFLKIGDSEYRVEANWNAIAGFCRKKGVSDLSQLDVLVHIAIDDILPLMHCCIKEIWTKETRQFLLRMAHCMHRSRWMSKSGWDFQKKG